MSHLHQQAIEMYKDKIRYSDKYQDDQHIYRHVILPKELKKYMPSADTLLTESEWRSLGIQQSLGWVHYMTHRPERNVLCFKRPLHG